MELSSGNHTCYECDQRISALEEAVAVWLQPGTRGPGGAPCCDLTEGITVRVHRACEGRCLANHKMYLQHHKCKGVRRR